MFSDTNIYRRARSLARKIVGPSGTAVMLTSLCIAARGICYAAQPQSADPNAVSVPIEANAITVDANTITIDPNTVIVDQNTVSVVPPTDVNETSVTKPEPTPPAVNVPAGPTVSFEQITSNPKAMAAWKDRTGAPSQTEASSDSRDALKKMVEMVRSVKINTGDPLDDGERYGQGYTQDGDPNMVITDPNRSAIDPDRPISVSTVARVVPGAKVTDNTAAEIRKRLGTSKPVMDALALADVLFKSGRRAEAAALYGQILKVIEPNNVKTANDRAWVLLQRGKCLQIDNGAEALECFQALLRDFPQSPWLAMAKAQIELVGWHAQDKPLDLLEQCRNEIAEARQLSKVEGIAESEQ